MFHLFDLFGWLGDYWYKFRNSLTGDSKYGARPKKARPVRARKSTRPARQLYVSGRHRTQHKG